MKTKFLRALMVLSAFAMAVMPMQAETHHCSNAAAAGQWAYTYTGTIFTGNGPLPTAAVGRFHQDAAGNITGSQVRTVAGNAAAEDISGTVTVNGDYTATATINVLVNGELQRTAVLAGVYDTNMNHARDIFQSLTLANGTNVPVVLTADVARLWTKTRGGVPVLLGKQEYFWDLKMPGRNDVFHI